MLSAAMMSMMTTMVMIRMLSSSISITNLSLGVQISTWHIIVFNKCMLKESVNITEENCGMDTDTIMSQRIKLNFR